MSSFLAALLIGYCAALAAGWFLCRYARGLSQRLMEDAVNHSMTTDFPRPDVPANLDAPPLEDSRVWGMPAPPAPSLDEALAVVLAYGMNALRCSSCASESTERTAVQWERWHGSTYLAVHEKCNNCGYEQVYRTNQIRWAAIAAQAAWALFKQAEETLDVAIANERDFGAPGVDLDQVRQDLRDLDDPPA